MAHGYKTPGSGRTKGTPNAITYAHLLAKLDEHNFDVVRELVDTLNSPEISPANRANLLLKLMEYVVPKRSRPVEERSSEASPEPKDVAPALPDNTDDLIALAKGGVNRARAFPSPPPFPLRSNSCP